MAYIRHATLTPNTVMTMTLPVPATENYSRFEILTRNGLDSIYVSYDGTATPGNPTVAGDNFDVVPATPGAWIQVKRIGTTQPIVKLISAQATTFSIKAIA